ncbi:hypothetical protein DFH09DRAFT_1399429 [Mycena vulgaris]|nr:hypothetical protein DFH09DRAFT_1399429 [Mycena vulgaris]
MSPNARCSASRRFLPADIGIPGGTAPTAAPPAGGTGPWTDPDPTSTSTSTSTNSASSSSSSSFCPQPTAPYALSEDTENADWEDEGMDPDLKRKRVVTRAAPRYISVNTCSIQVVDSGSVSLRAGEYYSIGLKALGGVNAALSVTQVGSRPVGNGPSAVAPPRRIQDNVFNFDRADGSNMGFALLQAIDPANYPCLMHVPAKSNVVNQNKAAAASPPQSTNINKITNFVNPANISRIQEVESFARNFGALGSYFGNTAATFQATALRIQNLLAEITPDSPDANLPTEFNSWLRDTGCTSRATNVFNYYVNEMNIVSAATGVTPVPACFPLYHSTNFWSDGRKCAEGTFEVKAMNPKGSLTCHNPSQLKHYLAYSGISDTWKFKDCQRVTHHLENIEDLGARYCFSKII